MGIRVVGVQLGPDYDAAQELKSALEEVIRPSDELTIVVGARCYGEPVQEIDIILLGTFSTGLDISAHVVSTEGEAVHLINLCMIIEVKDHSDHAVSFSGQQVLVKYDRGKFTKDATTQVHDQMRSLINYLKRERIPAPRIATAVWLRNYAGEIPLSAVNVIKGKLKGSEWISLIHRIMPPKKESSNSGPYISFTKNKSIREIVEFAQHFSEPFKSGNIDRRRLEVICKKVIGEQKYAENLGKQLLVFRGRGGSGKTLHLLRIAKDLHDLGNRVLLLTFNKALVSDIRRLMMLVGIGSETTGRGIKVETAHKYFFEMLNAWGMWRWADHTNSSFPTHEYETKKNELLELVRDETVESLTKEDSVVGSSEVFAWDYIMVDEGQDWPLNERDLLYKMFGPEKCIVADGVDQLTRRNSSCDWISGQAKTNRQVVPLRKSLRMKSNLSRFVQMFADKLGVIWDQEISDDVVGGRVTFVFGEYTKEIHAEMLSDLKKDGNEPIDALFCIPSARNNSEESFVSKLQNWGCDVWDGTSSENRGRYPVHLTEHRVVHYESCRGLEGWSVVCLGVDRHFRDKYNHAPDVDPTELFETSEMVARRFAAQWFLIPLTRAIDHLILQLEDHGEIRNVCEEIAKTYPDFVSVIHSKTT